MSIHHQFPEGVLHCWAAASPQLHLLQMLTKSDNLWQAGKIKAIDFDNQRRFTSDPTWKALSRNDGTIVLSSDIPTIHACLAHTKPAC